ncbi:acyltransferase family protein [Peribacillus sp. NPDC096379]|uniref:acyltransferase family protein n=1 Tax=Peribacillus sp. NPDC096379 TaxID=3364393 RepID=UPI003804FF6E
MTNRNFYFDNAKFILIAFVVFGHLLNSYIQGSEGINALYKTIYSFHMPAFILVSGFFAKGFYQKGYISKITKRLIIPYLIFQVIYSIFYFFLYDKTTLNVDLLNPHWSLWFLISLFFWNIMLLGFAKLKPLTGIVVAFGITLLIGYVDIVTNFLSLSRTFVFFPLFLIGYHLKKEHLAKLFNPKIRLGAAMIMVIVFIGFYLYPDINYKWLLGSKPYSELETASIISMFKRLGFYGLSLLMVFSFLSLIPRERHFFTKWGEQTLYVYLLHGFIIRTFRESNIKGFFTDAENYVMLAGISFLLTILLSSKFVTSLAQPIIEVQTTQFVNLINKFFLYLKFYKKRWQDQ